MRPSTFIVRVAALRLQLCLALCLGLCAPATLAAQQGTWRSVGAPEGGNITSLVRSTRGNLYATTLDGFLFASADDGATWRRMIGPLAGSLAGRGVTAVHAAPGGALFVFAGANQLFRSTDEGSTWRPLSEGLRLHPVLMSDSSGALLGAGYGGLVRSTDNGESWTQADEEYTEVMAGLQAGPGGVDYALRTVIYDNGRGFLKRSFDGGRTWAYMDTAASPFRYTSLAVSPRGTVFLGTHHDGVLRSTDRGQTWWYATGGDSVDAGISGITVLPGGEVVAMTGNELLRSTDDGLTWRRMPVSVAAGGMALPVAVASAASGNGLLVGTVDAGILRVGGSGESWSIANNGLRGLGVQLLRVAPNGTIFAVSEGRLYRSTDGGLSWTDLFRDVSAWLYPPVITREGALLVSLKAGNLEGILRSTDQGNTWDTVASEHIVWRVASAPDGRLYASTLNEGLYRSTDDGRTWSRFGPSREEMLPTAFHFDGSGEMLVGTFEGGAHRISLETGATRPVQQLGSGWIKEIVEFRGVLYAVGAARGLYRSTDDGNAWEIYNTTSLGLPTMLAGGRDSTLWGVNLVGVMRSTDGENWTPVNDGLPATGVRAIEIGPDGRVWAATADGLYVLSVPSAAPADAAEAAGLSAAMVRPVPARGGATLDLRMSRAAEVRCRLFDVVGRQARAVFGGRLEAGAHAVALDLTGLPEGSYVLEIDIDGARVTRMIPIAAVTD